MDLELDLDPELTPSHDLRWDTDGNGARDGEDPKLEVKKLQPNYGYGAGSTVDPPHKLRWDIDGTGAGDEVDPKWR